MPKLGHSDPDKHVVVTLRRSSSLPDPRTSISNSDPLTSSPSGGRMRNAWLQHFLNVDEAGLAALAERLVVLGEDPLVELLLYLAHLHA